MSSTYNLSSKTSSFYIHWPFCPYKCHFCPFVALSGHDSFMGQYHQALKKEIIRFFDSLDYKPNVETIYFGGGTPSTYPPDLLLDTFDTIRTYSFFNEDAEISIEVNPGTVSKEKIAMWEKVGVNRLSLGVQSLNNNVLHNLNRLQKKEDVYWFLENTKKKFKSISIDLILGLPGVSDDEWKDLVKEVSTWPINHISIYFLTIHENTPLFFRLKKNQLNLPEEDSTVDLYFWTTEFLKNAGFDQYETSSFCKGDNKSKHNTVYWEHKPYKAFGLGACSFDGKNRFQNEKNLIKYLKDNESNKDSYFFCEELTDKQLHFEKVMLGLRRLHVGVSVTEILKNLSKEAINEKLSYIQSFISRGLIKKVGNRIFLTPKGVILENEIVVRLSE